MLPFSGPAKTLEDGDVAAAAERLGCPAEAVHAVCVVETGGAGGFLSDGSGRPRILFEARQFGDATRHVYDVSNPDLSVRLNNWRLYLGGAAEYNRLARAIELDRTAALASTSWGMFQIMGSNAASLGFPSVEVFVIAMAASEGQQLEAFVGFVQHNGLANALRRLDWAAFARGYNGSAYSVNNYDVKLAAAYEAGRVASKGAPLPVTSTTALTMGMRGDVVSRLQMVLAEKNFPCGAVDGVFGRSTQLAVRRYQSSRGLPPDGVVGLETRLSLFGKSSSASPAA